MTRIHLLLQTPSPSGIPVAADGQVTFRPTRKQTVVGDPDATILPAPFTEEIGSGGLVSVELTPTGLEWAWEVRFAVVGMKRWTEYVAVPDMEDIDYSELVRVDPRSLEPLAEPTAVWYAYVEALRVEAELAKEAAEDSKVASEDARDDADAAAGSIGPAVTAAASSATAASGSATAAAGSATAAAGSATAAAGSATTAAGHVATALTHRNAAAASATTAATEAATVSGRLARAKQFGNQIHTVTNPSLAKADRATSFSVPMPGNSNVVVHPSVYYNPEKVSGYEYWMAFTPYPSANSQMENPCIVASRDGTNWVVPAGVVNPIEPAPANWPGSYNSDPYLTRGNDGTFYCFWRQVGEPTARETWWVLTSQDLITWSGKTSVVSTLMSAERFVSASIFQEEDGTWVFYGVQTVGTPFKLYRMRSATLLGLNTAARELCAFTGSWNGVQPWHIDVQRVGGEYHMLVQDGDSGGGNFWAAISNDGLDFKAGPQLVDRGPSTDWDSSYYKGCFVPVIKDGVFGWDTWITSSKFPATGPAQGRTFVAFDGRHLKEGRQAFLEQESRILFARNGIWPFLVGDSFTSPDSTGLGTSETGHLWTVTNGAYNIAGKAAVTTTTGNNKAWVESGVTDHWATVRIDSLASLGQQWVLARFADQNNHYRFGTNGADFVLEKIVAGGATNLNTVNSAKALIPTKGVYVGLRCLGTTIEGYINGVKVLTVADSALTAGTKVGIQASPSGATFRAFTAQAS